MSIKSTIIFVILAAVSSSCVSNYVVSSNSYAATPKNYYTPNGTVIPKANAIYENSLDLEDDNTPVLLNSSELEKDINMNESSAVMHETLLVQNLIEEAKTYLGTPYRYGGTTRNGIDCSAFTQKVFYTTDISLPRVARSQASVGEYISKENLKKGDLVFFITRGRSISHVGIVEKVDPETGEVFFIHASSSSGVSISSLNSAYWSARFRYGKRVIS